MPNWARRKQKKRNLHELPYTEIINPGELDSPLVNNWNDEVKTTYVYTWVPGGVAHVHERGEGLGGVGHSHAHIHPAQASALRQRVFYTKNYVHFVFICSHQFLA